MKSKKIGVFTLGTALIAFGVLFLLRVFIPWWDYRMVLRFWPVVLILLGLEVLLSALLPRKEGAAPAKADALSIVLLFLTLFLACGLATAEVVLERLPDFLDRVQERNYVDFGRTHSAGRTDHAVVTIGDSAKFSEDELQDAVDCILEKFWDFEDCDLQRLWYDEERSDKQVQSYMTNGKGSENGVEEGNVIVLFSDFRVGWSAGGGWNPGSNYTDWMWILIRDGEEGEWRADDWGY